MEYIINRSQKYHQAKSGKLADGIFSSEEIHDCIYGLILYYLKSMKEDNIFPNINIENLQNQTNYLSILLDIKEKHFKKINFKDKKIFLSIILLLELKNKSSKTRGKI